MAPRLQTRGRTAILALALATVVSSVAFAGTAQAAPPTPNFPRAIEPYAAYDPQDSCDPVAKPGAIGLRDLLNAEYGPHTSYFVIGCNTAGISEHKEGRALDYMLNANNSTDMAIATDIMNWLFATDRHGNTHANARRLGIMYVIWNRRIWVANNAGAGWQPYNGDSPHTDHIHFSLSWAGARKGTSWWTQGGGVFGGTDLNGDGYADLWALTTSDMQLVYPNKRDETGAFYSSKERGNASFRLADLGDLDGNGSADLYAVTTWDEQLWYPNKGVREMEFWSARSNGPAPRFRLMSLGDIDADGFADLIAVYRDTNELMVYINKRNGTFWSARLNGYAPAFKSMDLGDIDGDGYADLYALTDDGRQLVYTNRGDQGGDTTRFWAARDIGNASFRVAQLGNLNGDRYADLYGITDDHRQIIYMNRGHKQTDTEKFWAGREFGAAPGIRLAAL